MRTITKKELTDRIAEATQAKRTLVKTVIQQFFDAVIEELANGNRLEFRDFGVFEVRTRKRRMAQNPRTLERVPVPVKSTVKFKVGRRMKEAVQNVASEVPPAEPESVQHDVPSAAQLPASPPPAT